MRWLLLVAFACGKPAPAPDPVVDDFRAVEHQCIAAFNDALHRQKRNEIDELALAAAIDRDVLPPWHAMRLRVDAAGKSELMRRYVEEREIAWQAYSAALHAPDDTAARPHYDAYHQKTADATRDARLLADELGPARPAP